MLTYIRSFILSFSVIMFAQNAIAQDSSADILKVDKTFQQQLKSTEVSLDLKRNSEKLLPPGLSEDPDSKGMAVDKPSCDNTRMIKRVLARINQYYIQKKSNRQIDKRQQTLTIKNLNQFVEEDINQMQLADKFHLANRIVSNKINNGFSNKDMRLCRSVSTLPIYLLIYPYNSVYKIEIINFPGHLDSENFTAIYD